MPEKQQPQQEQSQLSIDELNDRLYETKKNIDELVTLYNTLQKCRQLLSNVIASNEAMQRQQQETQNKMMPKMEEPKAEFLEPETNVVDTPSKKEKN